MVDCNFTFSCWTDSHSASSTCGKVTTTPTAYSNRLFIALSNVITFEYGSLLIPLVFDRCQLMQGFCSVSTTPPLECSSSLISSYLSSLVSLILSSTLAHQSQYRNLNARCHTLTGCIRLALSKNGVFG